MTESMPPVADLVATVYGQVSGLVESASDEELRRPTRAEAWTVAELLFHLLLDAQRVLTTLASPTPRAADVDAVSYWRPFRPEVDPDQAAAHARYVQRAAAAYASPRGIVDHWRGTAEPAVRAAQRADPGGRVGTQGHVLVVTDFLSTISVEATVHYLDLGSHLDAVPADAEALRHTRAVLDRILEQPLPRRWSDEQAVLIGTGRVSLPAADRLSLGEAASRLPLLG